MAADVKKIAEELVKLTVLEVNELKNVLKDEYGIEPAAAAVAVAAPAEGAARALAEAHREDEPGGIKRAVYKEEGDQAYRKKGRNLCSDRQSDKRFV